ncbi:MAG TPA: CAP domain-containing protein [Thermoanaerobaculia bacterium]|nr:CAP domain-containing protein [Thermoanaerobaculia bacterium]
MKRFVLVLVLLDCGSIAAALESGGSAAAVHNQSQITRERVIELMNAYRAEVGLPPLREDARLNKAAEDRMRDMEDQAYWSHESPAGVSPFAWITARGYSYNAAAENLATGFETAGLLVASWMESPGHRASILSPDFHDCGIAIIDGATTGPSTGRSVVVLFGAPYVMQVTLPGSTDPPRAPTSSSHP